jgi:hypothetical protein
MRVVDMLMTVVDFHYRLLAFRGEAVSYIGRNTFKEAPLLLRLQVNATEVFLVACLAGRYSSRRHAPSTAINLFELNKISL